jgi:hypothetical protein
MVALALRGSGGHGGGRRSEEMRDEFEPDMWLCTIRLHPPAFPLQPGGESERLKIRNLKDVYFCCPDAQDSRYTPFWCIWSFDFYLFPLHLD